MTSSQDGKVSQHLNTLLQDQKSIKDLCVRKEAPGSEDVRVTVWELGQGGGEPDQPDHHQDRHRPPPIQADK